ncbi:MAG: hypothetical protein LQ339_000670 [Xanthoria mediterranea]|nr:MAG: hypothetical protein LQ339_000670 [Xanthoria mediterranea]
MGRTILLEQQTLRKRLEKSGNAWLSIEDDPYEFDDRKTGKCLIGMKSYHVGGDDGARLTYKGVFDALQALWHVLYIKNRTYEAIFQVENSTYLVANGKVTVGNSSERPIASDNRLTVSPRHFCSKSNIEDPSSGTDINTVVKESYPKKAFSLLLPRRATPQRSYLSCSPATARKTPNPSNKRYRKDPCACAMSRCEYSVREEGQSSQARSYLSIHNHEHGSLPARTPLYDLRTRLDTS